MSTTGPTGPGTPTLDEDDALTLALNNVQVFLGTGGSLSDTTSGVANNTPDDYSDDEVVEGTFGLRGAVTAPPS